MVVNDRGQEVVYWRYFLTPEPEALRMIKGSQRDATGAEQKAEKAERVKDADSVPERKPSDATPGDTKSKDQESKDEAREVQEPRADAPAKEGLKKEDAVRPAKSEEIKLPSPAMHEPEAKAEPKKRAPKTKSAAFPAAPSQPSLQDWLIHDTLYEKVQIFAVGQKGIITHQQSIKPNAELTCMLTNDGPYGRLSVMVYAVNKKKVAEKDITQALLQARGHGVPLLVLSVEEIPVKITKSFESTLNIYFRKF
jgi:hypothetical protein